MAANLEKMIGITRSSNVQILLETHDDWLCSNHLKAVMEKVDSTYAGILWDVHHPYRMKGETPAETWATLGPWIKNTHWKDSRSAPESERGYQLCLFGNGDIPLKEIFNCLKNDGYNECLTLEWEKAWNPEIEEPEIAFPGFVKVMRQLMQ